MFCNVPETGIQGPEQINNLSKTSPLTSVFSRRPTLLQHQHEQVGSAKSQAPHPTPANSETDLNKIPR